MPEQSINEQTRQMMGMPTSGDPAIIDPTTGRPYTADASMRQQEEITRQAEAKEGFASEQKLQLPKDLEEEIEKQIRPKARPEGLPTVYEKKTAIDKTLEYGYLLRERQPGAKGKTRVVTGLDERNPAHQKTIKAFFDNAVGGDTGFDPSKQAWCAAFVNHILTEMGADLIESKDPYKRLRANEYKTYGKPVDLKNIQEGDIVVFDFDKDGTADHVTFYAGGRITSQGEGQHINVIGGNQGGGVVSIKENAPGYTLDNVAAIRRITYDGDAYEIAQSHKDSDPIFKTFLPGEHKDYAQAQANRLGSYNEGGDVAAQMDLMLPSADDDTRSTKEFLQHPLETVPYFQRPMGSSTDDPQVGQDDAGNPVFKGSLGEYTVRVNPDQRTLRTKVEEAIPVVKEAVGDYLKDPKLPTKDQLSEFAKQAGQSAVESVEDLGDLMFKGKGTLGDVFAVAAGAGAASVPFDVPKGALRIFGGVNAEDAYEDKNLKKAVRLLKGANVDPTNVQESYFKNKEIWKQTGWYVDPKDGQWRFEIDDSKSKLKDFKNVFNTELEPTSPAIDPEKSKNFFNEIGNVELSKEDGKYRKLNEVFDHEDFYKRYPDLKDINVIFYSNPKNRLLLGSAGDDEIFINLSAYDNYEDIKSTLLHELQHVVQFEEGFVPGSSTSQVPQSLIENKTKELEEKKRPLTVKQAVIKNKQKLLSDRIKEEKEEHSKKPLPNITEKQQIEIFKLKPYNSDKNDYDGPSWASIARDYKVTPAEIKKAYGREMLLVNLAKEKKTLDLLDYKIASDLFEIEDENFNVEMEFYKGAGGEIESRLAQRRANLSSDQRGPQNIAGGFPLDDRVDMLQEEGGKFQYTGSAGVDPYAYQMSPRVEPDPEKPGFLSGVKKKLGLTSDSAVDKPKAANSPDEPKNYAYRTDNPATKGYEGGEEWLESKQKTAEDRAKNSSEENSTGKLLSGSITGYMGQDFKRPLFLSTEMLSKLKGANDEKRYVGEGRYDLLRKRVDKEGFDPEQKYSSEDDYGNAIVIGVNHKGEAFITEGNTRVAVAKDLDVPSIRAEVKYYNGAEEVGGPYSPQNIIQYADKPKDFNKGGAVMNEQMEMAFMQQGGLKDDGMKRDPVSGNEVPNGSMASEVRDDIPAQLSEGEYVVPADVVRFFGVKFFEDLRSEAKMGLQSMEANGRIGGEPVPMETGELSDEEFARLLQQELGGTLTTQNAEPIKAAEGTYVPGQMSSFNPDNYGLGFSLTPGYTPPAAVGTEPVVETEASCAARNMVLGPDGVCIVAPQVKNDNDNDGPIVPAPGKGQGLGGAWYEEDEQKMLNDPEAYITGQLGRGEMLDSGLARAGVMTLPGGIILAAGNSFADTEGIARARAALMIAKARGTLSAEKIKSLEDAISKDTQGNFIVDKDGKGLGIGTGINYANSFAKSLGFKNLEDAYSKDREFLEATSARASGFATDANARASGFATRAMQDPEKRKAMLDQIDKRSKEKQAEIDARASSGSDNDDRQSAADAMKDRLDRMAKAEGQSEGFQGSVTSGAVYAGGNRAEGGLMLKKKRKKK